MQFTFVKVIDLSIHFKLAKTWEGNRWNFTLQK